MKKSFSIGLNKTDIQKVINYCERMHKRIPQKADELCKRLAEEGSRVAQDIYGSAVSVSVVRNDSGNGYIIRADGRAVAFLEFGAGYGVNPANPLAANAATQGLYVYWGSYSAQNAGELIKWDFWIFGGKKMDKVPARNALWEADKRMAQELSRIAQEVFES